MRNNFKIGEVVIVINPKHKYYGERGTIKKVTSKMLWISMKKKGGLRFLIKKENVKGGSSPYPVIK